jgi:hypothetical protein
MGKVYVLQKYIIDAEMDLHSELAEEEIDELVDHFENGVGDFEASQLAQVLWEKVKFLAPTYSRFEFATIIGDSLKEVYLNEAY